MATITATRGGAKVPVSGHGFAGNMKVAYGSHTFTANPPAGTIIEMVRLPKGAMVLGGEFYGDIIDTGTSAAIDIDIGWAANGTEALDADGFGNFGVTDAAVAAVTGYKPEATGFRLPLGNVLLTTGPQSFSAETVIRATVNASAATFSTASHINLAIYYVLD